MKEVQGEKRWLGPLAGAIWNLTEMSIMADCEMCGMIFVPWKPPDVVCRACAKTFVKFIDDTIIEGVEGGCIQDGPADVGDFPGPSSITS